ncbi:uncharacterized protein LOC131064682 [Cryptomeria japonica]|uniref:uncharacterized protein LOC131064682 n=1 Tax=Cryptomeria japonica TaxID=3369 RepID=UPI0027D9CF4E|nr:uncharacterized protein LOC131064682 [Cryptomeria japonica]
MQGLHGQFAWLCKGVLSSSLSEIKCLSTQQHFHHLVDNSAVAWLRPHIAGFIRNLHYFRCGSEVRSLNPHIGIGQQRRGIRMRVRNGNVEETLKFMQRRMTSSGMERLIRNAPRWHIKDSEKRILAQKKREKKERSQNLARKLKSILVKKVRGL